MSTVEPSNAKTLQDIADEQRAAQSGEEKSQPAKSTKAPAKAPAKAADEK